MLEKFELASVVKCLPKQWKENTYTQDNFLSFNCQLKRDIEIKMKPKGVYKNIIKEITIPPLSENFFQTSSIHVYRNVSLRINKNVKTLANPYY